MEQPTPGSCPVGLQRLDYPTEELDGDGSLPEVLEPDGSWVTGEDPGELASKGVESLQED